MQKITNDQLKKFFEDRPALSKEMIAKEAGLGARTLVYYLQDDPRPVTERSAEKLLPVLEKYGWDC